MAHKTTIATKEKNERLYRAILALETEEECYAFFQDLCTIAELRSMEQRYEVATLLSEGMVYSDILERIWTDGYYSADSDWRNGCGDSGSCSDNGIRAEDRTDAEKHYAGGDCSAKDGRNCPADGVCAKGDAGD